MNQDLIAAYYKESYRKHVKKMLFKVYGNEPDAEDIVQEAFTRAIRWQKGFNPEGKIEAWFSVILRNAYKRWKMEQYNHPDMEEFDEEIDELIPEFNVHKETTESIYREIKKVVNENEREVLRLYFCAGITAKGISEITDFKQDAVKYIIRSFKNKMRGKDMR